EWRLAGARVLARACELVGANENIPYECITAAGLLNKAGERGATIQFLEPGVALSDDEAIRERALAYLPCLLRQRPQARPAERSESLRRAWKRDLPFVTLTTELVLGPPSDTAACAGPSADHPPCASTWAAWRAQERAPE